MKIQKILPTITPFAGISFVKNLFSQSGLSQLIDNELGYRPSTKEYQYSDIISNYNNIFYCGGDCAEDIQSNIFAPPLKLFPTRKYAVPTPCFEVSENLQRRTKYLFQSKGNHIISTLMKNQII